MVSNGMVIIRESNIKLFLFNVKNAVSDDRVKWVPRIYNGMTSLGLNLDNASDIICSLTPNEKGALPSESINNLLKQIMNDEGLFAEFFEKNKSNLSEDENKKIESVLSNLSQKIKTDSVLKAYVLRNENSQANVNDGFRKFDFNKFKNMVIYLISNGRQISKTRLNKLLFYCDFTFFNENSISISGATYIHDHYGPVPSDFELLYTALYDQNVIDFVPFSDGHGEKMVTNKKFDSSYFSNQELTTIENISNRFRDYNAIKITEYSHKEPAYINTELKNIISYRYAFDLN